MTGQVRLDIDAAIARITIANPAKLNALTFAMYENLVDACRRLARATEVRATVLRGEGGRAFAAGTDIGEFATFAGADDGIEYERRTAAVLDAFAAIPVPVIAAVEGPAAGGGLALVLCCDVVIAREDATFAAPVAKTLGNCLSPLAIGRLYASIGRARARALLSTAGVVDAPTAQAWGLVTEVIPADRFDERVEETASRVASLAPRTQWAHKEIDRRLMRVFDAVHADDIYAACYGSADFHEGVRAFLAKRRPVWSGQ
ncbi:MAG TPA: enoyl-CoA hydratase [Streptosporangiaceae bacterium]|nr:enoyl-CoA hydratase [Streptosporangiaceae bacterium]